MTQNPDLKPTAPISEDADMNPAPGTCLHTLYTMFPDLQQNRTQPEAATEEPSSDTDEDSEDEGTFCQYCDDMEDHESGRCNYLREATAEVQRTYLRDRAT